MYVELVQIQSAENPSFRLYGDHRTPYIAGMRLGLKLKMGVQNIKARPPTKEKPTEGKHKWYAAVVNESPDASWSMLAAAYDKYIRKARSWPVDDVELLEKTKAEVCG